MQGDFPGMLPKDDGVGARNSNRGQGRFHRIGRYNKREVRPLATINDVMLALGGGQRLEILSALARGPMNVTALGDRMLLTMSMISRELAYLERRGLVVWERDKNFRNYALGPLVKAFVRGEMVQLCLSVLSGHWLLAHLDEGAAANAVVMPPAYFIDNRGQVSDFEFGKQ